jgi:hypothetical protein
MQKTAKCKTTETAQRKATKQREQQQICYLAMNPSRESAWNTLSIVSIIPFVMDLTVSLIRE